MAPPGSVTAGAEVDARPPSADPLEELELRLLMRDEGLSTISALQDRILHDPKALPRLVNGLSVSVTSMYRDPGFFRAFRQEVVPLLRTYPLVRIWHAGC